MTRCICTAKLLAAYLCFVALSPLLPGCGDGGGTICDLSAAFSVQIKVTDEKDTIVQDAKVVYSVDGGQEQAAQCLPGTGASCETWTAGVETAGKFTLKAESADGMKHAEATVDVTKGECHVETQMVTLKLQ